MSLDRSTGVPLPVQLAAALREAIDAATLRPGEAVPATRELARRLGIARGVVVAAYEQLVAEGYLTAVHGRGTAVNPALAEAWSRGDAADAPLAGPDGSTTGQPPADESRPGPLAPGIPIADTVTGPAWRAAWKESASRLAEVAPPLGDPELRARIAEHLRLTRGTARPARDVIVTAGTRDGLGLLIDALGGGRGREFVIGVEDPGLPTLRGAAARHGARIVALPADDEGLDTARLPDGVLDAVIVTPSHQYPLGGSLPLPRRRELLSWAHRTGVIVIEDDYDSELRFTGSPLPALAALDDPVDGSVVLLGTFSRTLSPALSAGFLLAPERLRSRLEPVRRDLGGPVSSVVQGALARYLGSGELRRHTARMLRRYAARRDAVSDALAGASGVRVRPMDGGLHAVIELVAGDPRTRALREAALLSGVAEEGLGAEGLGGYWQHDGAHTAMRGLVLGIGGSDDAEFVRALGRLRDLIDAAARIEETPSR
ncbi:PLP-dependent aminotransferase family protein [Leucobacter edaphi]|uniref:MocR-like pyridoxine biosynthesis transcription factor PdxR n=1 Tax=Leucobacter edaphi TaxID=2796472 RepID=UPI0034E1C965